MEVDEKTWESEVIRRSGETPVLVDFWAEWCKPCKALTPVLEEAVEQRDVVLATVDVEANKNLAREYGIAEHPGREGVQERPRGRPGSSASRPALWSTRSSTS